MRRIHKTIELITLNVALATVTIAPLLVSKAMAEAPEHEQQPAIEVRLDKPVKPPLWGKPVVDQDMPKQFILDEANCPDDGCICISSLDDRGVVTEMKCSPVRQQRKEEVQ
jgi:hypothetical protein